jgi:hypothetical protein
MTNQNFSYSFKTSKSPEDVFDILSDPKKWWVGLHNESIKGKSKKLNDEFSFSAGDGAHFSLQKLIESVPGEKISWQVTESNLSFLRKPDEWTGTKIGFVISEENNNTNVVFTHEGLVPKIECYGGCAGAWTKYLEKLKDSLK